MSLALLVSRSKLMPQAHACQRSARVFRTSAPHPEQSCDVMDGFTKSTVRPALAALTLTISVNVLHPASKIDLLSPAFADAPLGRYFPLSSCLGCGLFTIFAACKSSNAMN